MHHTLFSCTIYSDNSYLHNYSFCRENMVQYEKHTQEKVIRQLLTQYSGAKPTILCK